MFINKSGFSITVNVKSAATTKKKERSLSGARVTHIYICHQKKIVIERTRDLNYLKFVATDFSLKTISPSAGENSGDLA